MSTSFFVGALLFGPWGEADPKRADGSLLLVGAPSNPAVSDAIPVPLQPRDHTPCPGCGACCIDAGTGATCVEATPSDCVLTFGGNPQAVGTDCHDFNGNGAADACEPSFPFCLPTADRLFCEGACPGPLPCNATKVRINLATFSHEVLECGCRDCRVCLECDAFPPPCIGQCPAPETCTRTEICYTREICDIECYCTKEVEEACCLPTFDVTCQMLTPSDCLAFGGTPQGANTNCLGHEACCLPDGSCTFVDRICCDDLGGTPLGAGAMCEGMGTCCYDITDDLCLYDTCLEQDGACCTANGGIFQGVGSVCEIQACCIDGLCCNLDEDCCVISGGVAAGQGTACAGEQGACCYDGNSDGIAEVCIVVDRTCCADLGGYFHGPGTTCSPNFGACCFGFTGGSCIEMNESCCADLEAGTFLGNGSICLGDNDGDGFDDACLPPCRPNPAGNVCNPTQCPNNQDVCVPTKVTCTPSGAVCTIIECSCQDPNRCHIDLPPGSPLPACLGGCPANQSCDEIITIDADGQFLHMCMCVAPEACCLPNADITCQVVLPSTCMAFGGTPQGPGSACLGHDACCLPDGSCMFADAVCCDDLGGSTQGPGSMCSTLPGGSCCYDITDDFCIYDTCVENQDPICCAANGGIPAGDDVNCAGVACCIDGLCCDISPECCVISGGVPGDPGSSCAGVQGACCYDGDGDAIAEVCIIADAACCAEVGGFFHGPGTTCSPNFGACCFGLHGGSCVEMNESCCGDLEGGTFKGNGSVCLGDSDGDGLDDACFAPDQACCLDGACIFVVPPACVSKGGVPQGIGAVCLGFEACCSPGGDCLKLVDGICCDDSGGTPQGAGTVCLGDADGDGRDDACSCGGCRLFGDIVDVHSKPDPDCQIDVSDLSCVLDDFVDPSLCAGDADIISADFSCVADGLIDSTDLLAVLEAFAGNYFCPHPCPPGACCATFPGPLPVLQCRDQSYQPGGMSRSDCMDAGGIYYGDGTTCPQPGCP